MTSSRVPGVEFTQVSADGSRGSEEGGSVHVTVLVLGPHLRDCGRGPGRKWKPGLAARVRRDRDV